VYWSSGIACWPPMGATPPCPPPKPKLKNPPPLLIPINNDSVVKDVQQLIDDQSPTFACLSPNYDIMQAIWTTILALPISSSMLKDIRIKTNNGQNLTPVPKWRSLRTGKPMPFTKSSRNTLAYSLHGCLALALLYFMMTDKWPFLHMWGQTHPRNATVPNQMIKGSNQTWETLGQDDLRLYRLEPLCWGIQETLGWLSNSNLQVHPNDLLLTCWLLQMIDNSIDGQWFACQNLWEDTAHVLTCSCTAHTIDHLRPTSGMGWYPKATFFIYFISRLFCVFPIFMHARHIFLCGTKVTFSCYKSPSYSGKSHLQNAAFFPVHCYCFIILYAVFALSPVLPVEL
jgi:hypothetical protein